MTEFTPPPRKSRAAARATSSLLSGAAFIVCGSATAIASDSQATAFCKQIIHTGDLMARKACADQPAPPPPSDPGRCAADVESQACEVTALEWHIEYFQHFNGCLETAPVCSEQTRQSWSEDHLTRCSKEASRAMADRPAPAGCGLAVPVFVPVPTPRLEPVPAIAPTQGTTQLETYVLRRDGTPERGHQLSLLGVAGYYGSETAGVAGFYSFPVLETTGLLNDALHVELGALFAAVLYSGGASYDVQLLGGVRYDLHLLEVLTLYVAARLGPSIRFARFGRLGLFGGSAVGMQFRIGSSLSIRGEVSGGTAAGPAASVGVSFGF